MRLKCSRIDIDINLFINPITFQFNKLSGVAEEASFFLVSFLRLLALAKRCGSSFMLIINIDVTIFTSDLLVHVSNRLTNQQQVPI